MANPACVILSHSPGYCIHCIRESSKHDENTRMFYQYMQGEDWETVVDNDTAAIIRHEKEIGRFFHKSLRSLKASILLSGSKSDKLISAVGPNYFDKVYKQMAEKIGHGTIHIFDYGGHPAMLTNQEEFFKVSMDFLKH